MRSRAATFFLTALLAACLGQNAALGSEARQQLERLFADSRSTPAAAAEQRQAHTWLRKQYPNDSRIDYAVGLALLGQHRYPDALRYLRRYAENEPTDKEAAWVCIWTELRLRNYKTAATDCIQLASRLGDAPNQDARRSAERLGMVFGYLEQTQSQHADEKHFADSKNKVLAALGAANLEPFDEGRQLILGKLTALQEARQARQDEENSKRDALLTQTAVNLEANRDSISTNQQAVQQAAEQAGDASRQLTVIQSQLRSIGRDRSALSAQIISLQAQLNSIQAANSGGENATGRIQVSIPDAAQMNNIAMSLGVLNKQAFDMDRRILALQQTAAELDLKYRQGRETASQGRAFIEKAAKRAQVLENRVSQLEQEGRDGSATLTVRMKSISTYFDSPLAVEQARVLDWFDGM